nr:RNA-directed DNA polymerase, eukaryota [Tanacetum cinerariifolium]
MGPDFYLAVAWFFDHSSFSIGCNSLFITLIPKSLDPKTVSEFRPISLIGCVYKVVTKILQNRLSLVISGLILDVQSAFLPNRQILDGPFIINELLARCHHKKQSVMVFKVDFAKAYDSIRWDYLEDVLLSFGFGVKWCKWIRGYDAIFIGDWSQNNLKGGNSSSINSWNDSSNKIKSRLSNWKQKTLSIGGRLTLFKSVLGAPSIYQMSLYKVPKAVLKTMEA